MEQNVNHRWNPGPQPHLAAFRRASGGPPKGLFGPEGVFLGPKGPLRGEAADTAWCSLGVQLKHVFFRAGGAGAPFSVGKTGIGPVLTPHTTNTPLAQDVNISRFIVNILP